MFPKFLTILAIALTFIGCKKTVESVDDFKAKVKGHWYCVQDSNYEEIIFNDSAFMAQGMAYGTMFRQVKYVYPDSLHFYDGDALFNKSKISFKDSTMTAKYQGGETVYTLISRLPDHERDYQLLFKYNRPAHGIFYEEWMSRWAAWKSGVKYERWQVNEQILSTDEKYNLLAKVDDRFVQAMLAADSNYQKNTLPLFHFFDANADGTEEIAFAGTAGAADEFFQAYKIMGTRYEPWIHEYGRLIHCATFRDTTWVVIYQPSMVGDEIGLDSVVTYTLAGDYRNRTAR